MLENPRLTKFLKLRKSFAGLWFSPSESVGFYNYPWRIKKMLCHAERSEASIIRQASSSCTVC